MPDPSTITAATVKARYPEFAAVADVTIGLVLDEARGEVDATWIGSDRYVATLALVAHLLATQGFGPAGQTTGIPGLGAPRKMQVGDVMIDHGQSAASSTATTIDAGYGATTYGLRFLELRRRSFPEVFVP